MQKDELTRKQVAEHFGVTPGCVRIWERAGQLKPLHHVHGRPRYSKESIEALKKKPANN